MVMEQDPSQLLQVPSPDKLYQGHNQLSYGSFPRRISEADDEDCYSDNTDQDDDEEQKFDGNFDFPDDEDNGILKANFGKVEVLESELPKGLQYVSEAISEESKKEQEEKDEEMKGDGKNWKELQMQEELFEAADIQPITVKEFSETAGEEIEGDDQCDAIELVSDDTAPNLTMHENEINQPIQLQVQEQ